MCPAFPCGQEAECLVLIKRLLLLPYAGTFCSMQVCRQADGYQPSMVAPEKGLRQLSSEALDHVTDPVNTCVQEVYNLLVNAAR